jgi:class 3 adenylate cyclase
MFTLSIRTKLTLILLTTSLIAIFTISYLLLIESEKIITEKTFDVCYNLAENLSLVAKEELLLNNNYESTKGIINNLVKSDNTSGLSGIFVFNKYGYYVAHTDQKKINIKVSPKELDYFKSISQPRIDKINEDNINKIRFEFPVFIEELQENEKIKLGFVIFEFNEKLLYQKLESFKNNIYAISFILLIFVLIFSYFISNYFSRNILALKKGAEIIGSGDLSLKIDLKSSDEIGDLAKTFNEMTEKLRVADEMKLALLQSYGRFVPTEFLEYLNKNSVLDVALGDQIETKMSVLFSDIRSFTTISEKMSADETFHFINNYLKIMGPCVTNHQGFIDKYIGDAVMALFRSPDQSIDSAIEMQRELGKYNELRVSQNLPRVSIGIGIHTGKLILGIVGSDLRIQGTVISDAVNLASRMEGLTKMYGASLLITDETLKSIENPSKYQYRIVDRVRVKGKNQPVEVIEILNGYSPRVIELKLKTLKSIDLGIQFFRDKQFKNAIHHFEDVLKIDPLDKAAEVHKQRSEYYDKNGVPFDWEGINSLSEK